MPFVAGTVTDAVGNPAARTVRIFHRDSGVLLGEAVSDAVTGEFTIHTVTSDEVQRIALDDNSTVPLKNDLIARVMPGGTSPLVPAWGTGTRSDVFAAMQALFHDDLVPEVYYLPDDLTAQASSARWSVAVLAPNGCIYGIPLSATHVLKIDPATDTVTTIGPELTGVSKYQAAVLASNGMIYAPPRYDTNAILKIDPATDTVTTFGEFLGTNKWFSLVEGANGKLYAAPYDYGEVLEIDPATDTATTFGSGVAAGSGYSRTLQAAANGNLYAFPYANDKVLKIDPVARTTTKIGNSSGSSYACIASVTTPDGVMYGLPYNMSSMMRVDPSTDTVTAVGVFDVNNTGTSSAFYRDAVVAPDGMVYALPYRAKAALRIDPATDALTFFGDEGILYKTNSSCFAPNGRIYAPPCSASTTADLRGFELAPASLTYRAVSSALYDRAETYLYTSSVLAPNGKIYSLPCNASKIQVLSFTPDPRARVSLDLLLHPALNRGSGGYYEL